MRKRCFSIHFKYKLVEPTDLSKVEIPKKFLQRNDMSLDTYAKKWQPPVTEDGVEWSGLTSDCCVGWMSWKPKKYLNGDGHITVPIPA